MNRITFIFLFSAAFLFASLDLAHAEIYEYTDAQGVIHFSNTGANGYKRVRHAPRRLNKSSRKSRTISAPVKTTSSSRVSTAYADIINSACDKHGLDPALVHAVVKVESNFNPYALSSKGAMGLMQLMPETAADLNVRNSFNPHENIDGGVRYLRYLIDRYDGDVSLALAAYNAGEGAVTKWGAIPPYKETQNYVKKIMNIYNGGTSVKTYQSRYTIYVGYDKDGSLLLTDNPGRHSGRRFERITASHL